jgi:hypothetical protein
VFTARYVLHSTFCPHGVCMCYVWIWEQTAIISLYNIDGLVFITETECLLRGTDGSLNKTHANVQQAKEARQTTGIDGLNARAVWPSRSPTDCGHLLGHCRLRHLLFHPPNTHVPRIPKRSSAIRHWKHYRANNFLTDRLAYSFIRFAWDLIYRDYCGMSLVGFAKINWKYDLCRFNDLK